MIETEKFEQVEMTSRAQLREWLLAHHTQQESVWVVTYKKHVPDRYVSVADVLDELLCVGWIDGIRRKLDDDRTMQLIGPRRAQHWARSYKERAAALETAGLMHPAGRQAIAESKRLGLWDFMDDVDDLVIPDDLADAMRAQPGAAENFGRFGDASQRFALRWIKLAKTPGTRATRITTTATLAAANKKVPGS